MNSNEAADFSEQLQELEFGMQSRLSAHLAQMRKELSEDIESFRQAALKNLVGEQKRLPQVILPPRPTVEVAQDFFAQALLEPARAVRVNGQVLHIHGQVLRRIPYFSAFLEGEWQDHDMPQVDLPCSSQEFGLLVRRLYTGEILGSSKLPIESCASAIRVAAAAGMLLIDQELHELQSVLITSVRSTEDMDSVQAAKATFPESLAVVFDELEAVRVPEDLVLMVSQSNSDHARTCADRILEACRGRFDSSLLIPTLAKLLDSRDHRKHQWAQKLMQKHMSCKDATVSIQQSGASWSFYCDSATCARHRESLQTVVGNHVVRCAKAGSLKAVFKLGTQRIQMSSIKNDCLCGQNRSQVPLLCFGGKCAGSVAYALVAMPHELEEYAAMMANMAPWQIRALVTEEVLGALGASAKPVLMSLAAEPVVAIHWCSIARLQIVPMSMRKSFCSKLTGVLDYASPELAVEIGQVLS